MVFCGQCGLQIPPGATSCPRCGTVAEASSDIDTLQADAPTVETPHYAHHPQSNAYSEVSRSSISSAPPDPQKLFLRPESGGGYGYGASDGNEPTSAMNAADYRTHQNTPLASQIGTLPTEYSTHPIYPVQAGSAYPKGNYIALGQANVENTPPGAELSGYPLRPVKQRGQGRVVALLVCLLLIVALVGFFVVQRANFFGRTVGSTSSSTNGGTGIATQSATPVPTDQAKTLVQQYYTDVNNKNYTGAYDLWKWGANGPSLTAFEQGYANTEHDNLTIRNATQLGDGTVRVLLTIVATERLKGKAKHHTYVGYYIVGQDGGTWKIFRGYLNRVK